ncbi:MAG: putative translation initiation inhibitor, yjgF family [Gemmatimonadetes bacterium]|nr:putative translation initiation inhibitor, yjgF family [Gemmatimonadota bacterium]
MKHLALLVMGLGFVAGCGAARAPGAGRPDFIIPSQGTGPFSSVVRVDHMLYLAGQIGTDSAGRVAKGGTGPETTAAMKHIERLLLQTGSSLDRVVKCTVMLADMKEWAIMNEAYIAFFPKVRPARSSFGTTGLALGARVEIECMATVD